MKKALWWIILTCAAVLTVALVLGNAHRKQTRSEVVAQLTYTSEDGSAPIYYYIVKTTYYETALTEVTGLNANAFRAVFDPDKAESTEEMMVNDWYGCRYVLPERTYLCWTVTPSTSYILEYDPNAVSDADILRMAQSVAPLAPED